MSRYRHARRMSPAHVVSARVLLLSTPLSVVVTARRVDSECHNVARYTPGEVVSHGVFAVMLFLVSAAQLHKAMLYTSAARVMFSRRREEVPLRFL